MEGERRTGRYKRQKAAQARGRIRRRIKSDCLEQRRSVGEEKGCHWVEDSCTGSREVRGGHFDGGAEGPATTCNLLFGGKRLSRAGSDLSSRVTTKATLPPGAPARGQADQLVRSSRCSNADGGGDAVALLPNADGIGMWLPRCAKETMRVAPVQPLQLFPPRTPSDIATRGEERPSTNESRSVPSARVHIACPLPPMVASKTSCARVRLVLGALRLLSKVGITECCTSQPCALIHTIMEPDRERHGKGYSGSKTDAATTQQAQGV